MTKTVDTPHAEYDDMASRWVRCSDVAQGTHALWEKTTDYLPALQDEKTDAYDRRLKRTVLFNATWRTIIGMMGLLFRKPAVVTVPPSVLPLMSDVTLTGVPIHEFAVEVSEDLLIYGRVGIWVNYPMVEKGATKADVKASGARPSMTHYDAKSILNWRSTPIGNESRLSMVVLHETSTRPDGEFAVEHVDQYRVLDLDNGEYRVRVFEVETDSMGKRQDKLMDGPHYPEMGGKRIKSLPFFFISPDDMTPEVDVPPLIDLVDTNIAHFQVTADYEYGCHWSGIPTVIVTGHEVKAGETIPIGGAEALVFPEPTAKAYLLEVGAGGFTALEKNLDRKEAQMVVLGARLLEVQKPGIEAAETALIHRAGEQSILASMAMTLSAGITRALQMFVEWAGEDSTSVVFWLNRDFFHAPISPEQINALVKSWQSKAISYETMFENLKRGEVYSPGATPEEERGRIDSAPDPVTVPEPVLERGDKKDE